MTIFMDVKNGLTAIMSTVYHIIHPQIKRSLAIAPCNNSWHFNVYIYGKYFLKNTTAAQFILITKRDGRCLADISSTSLGKETISLDNSQNIKKCFGEMRQYYARQKVCSAIYYEFDYCHHQYQGWSIITENKRDQSTPPRLHHHTFGGRYLFYLFLEENEALRNVKRVPL